MFEILKLFVYLFSFLGCIFLFYKFYTTFSDYMMLSGYKEIITFIVTIIVVVCIPLSGFLFRIDSEEGRKQWVQSRDFDYYDAYDDGYKAGYSDGKYEGYDDAYNEGYNDAKGE